jgi:hypothetical protein
MAQTRKNVRSTKSKPFEVVDSAPLQGQKKRDVYMQVYDARDTVFSDQTGQFPKQSQAGNKYLMVLVDIDSSAILVEPLKSRKDAELTRAYRAIMTRLHRAGIKPKKHVLDNEISAAMKALITDEFKLTYELVPPGCHRRNAAEVAIRNFKAHFLSIMAGVADDFPWHQWDKLLPQAEITINLLRQANAAPAVSAYAYLHGPFDYNKMPLAPLGCRVQVHEKTDQRGTWDFHSVDGWYLSTSPEHYRTHLCHIKSTRRDRLSDTVQFMHKNITNPTLTPADKIMNAVANCYKALRGQPNHESDAQLQQMKQLLDATAAKFGPSNDDDAEPPTATQQPVPRVADPASSEGARTDLPDDRRHTRSMTAAQPAPRVEPNLQRILRETPPTAAPTTLPTSRPSAHANLRASDHQGASPTEPPSASPNPSKTPLTSPSAPPSRRRPRKRRLSPSAPAPKHAAPSPPAANTRAATKRQTKLQQRQGPPARNTRSHKPLDATPTKERRRSRIPKPTRITTHEAKACRALANLERRLGQAFAVLDQKSGKMLNYRQLLRHPDHRIDWTHSSANEFGRLAQGVGDRIKGTDTIRFIRYEDIPKDRRKDVTYGQFVCTVRPEKKEPLRTRLTIGGDRINYPDEVATPTAEMLVAKILFNSVVSTKGAKFMTMDISNFYLNTPLKRPEYVRLKLSDIPDEIITEYKLRALADRHDNVYVAVVKGMYGLPQAGLLANELLEKRLNKAGYFQSKYVPGLWSHKWRPIQFTLVVDDFGVKYVGEEHAQHLKATLEEHYKVTTDWSGGRYIGINLLWDYKRRRVHLSMPGYVEKALQQFGHAKPTKPQHAPYPCAPIKYGAKRQYATEASSAPPATPKEKKWIQRVVGKFLFYGRAVDSTLLCPISAIASQSATPTKDTLARTKQLLDYLATQDEAIITYNASDMVLAVHSDASYLSEPKARSRAGGHFFLSNTAEIPPNNGAILNIAHVIKHVMSSATEAELAALYIAAREAVYIRIILQELGHEQPPTPLQTDNAMADGVINGKVTPKRTKAMDMRFHWLRDRECQEQFLVYWRPGKMNYADYWTKHHSAKHHKNVRREFLTPPIVLEMLRLEQAQHAPAAPSAAAA